MNRKAVNILELVCKPVVHDINRMNGKKRTLISYCLGFDEFCCPFQKLFGLSKKVTKMSLHDFSFSNKKFDLD